MEKKKMVAITIIVILIASVGSVWFLTRDGTSNGGEDTYHGDASEYLLTEDEIGNDWTKNKTREPNYESEATETGRVINFDRNGDNLTVVVEVLESIEDAEQLMDDRRSEYESVGYTERDLGDESISAGSWRRNFFDVRISNVYIQVYSNINFTNLRGYTEQQVEKISG